MKKKVRSMSVFIYLVPFLLQWIRRVRWMPIVICSYM